MCRYTRVAQLPRRTVQGCANIPGVRQLPSRTVQCCAGIPGVRQLPSNARGIVRCCTCKPWVYWCTKGRTDAEQDSTWLYMCTRCKVVAEQNITGLYSYRAEQYRAVQIYQG